MSDIIKYLDSGLILRRSRKEDTEALVAFNCNIHAEDKWDEIGLAAWTKDLMSGKHPTFQPDEFTIVEDPSDKKIISCMNLISQIWTYEGIPFGVGRPELVGTLLEYRRKGLVREQFKVIHQWSEQKGELLQAITGIPYYYRRFGYEMTINLGGGRTGFAPNVVQLKEGEQEVYVIRKATTKDLQFIATLYDNACKRSMVTVHWDQSLWKYELNHKSVYNINGRLLHIIEDTDKIPVGFLAVPGIKWRNAVAVTAYEISGNASWLEITPSVVRWLWRMGEQQAHDQSQKNENFGFYLGESHPVYEVFEKNLPQVVQPYAWYIRIPDLVAFLNKIIPVLETRIEESAIVGYSGSLSISFYESGVKIIIEKGKIEEIQLLSKDTLKECSAEFPGKTFFHILFGWRSTAEVRYLFPDCSWRNQETKILLDILFPKKVSNLWPIA
jgi:hypothetical protein